MISLQSVYRHPDHAVPFLYLLLSERTAEQSISHSKMPTLREHEDFYESKPYQCWYLILNKDNDSVGSIYLSKNREIGVFVLNKFQRRGYGRAAVEEMMRRWPGRFLANANPVNTASQSLFMSIGFNHLQNTYSYG